jgi:hypothetical protein
MKASTYSQTLSVQLVAVLGILGIMLLIGLTYKPILNIPDIDNSLNSAAVVLGTGKTYYVSQTDGKDTNNGLSTATPFKTIGKINSLMTAGFLKAGDNVLFKKGDVWAEKLVVVASGQKGRPITFTSYGSGNKPLFDSKGVQDFGIFLNSTAYVNIGDIGIAGVASVAAPSAGLGLLNANNTIIDGVTITDTKGLGGVYIYSSTPGRGQNNVLQNSTIQNTAPSSFALSTGNSGNGVQLWAECATCGKNNTIKNNTVSQNNGNGMAVFMPSTTITNNTITDNKEMGITAANDKATGIKVTGNTIANNCLAKDDCFGVNFFRSGGNNIVSNNILNGQHDTIADKAIPANPFPGFKVGTGGIRFDGGDAYSVSLYGPGADYSSATGNQVANNQINKEYDGVQVYNFSNITITGNTITDSGQAGIRAFSDNKANAGQNKPITVTIKSNNISSSNKSAAGVLTPNSVDTVITK